MIKPIFLVGLPKMASEKHLDEIQKNNDIKFEELKQIVKDTILAENCE